MYLALNDSASSAAAVSQVQARDDGRLTDNGWDGCIHREYDSECVPLYAVQVIWSDENPMMWRGKGDGVYWATDWADPNERGWAKPPAFLPDAPPYGKLHMLWAPRLPDVFGVGCEPNNTRREPTEGDGGVEDHPWAWLRDQVRGVMEQPRRALQLPVRRSTFGRNSVRARALGIWPPPSIEAPCGPLNTFTAANAKRLVYPYRDGGEQLYPMLSLVSPCKYVGTG
jgi:hypothetical protein